MAVSNRIQYLPRSLPGEVTLQAASKAPDRTDSTKSVIGIYVPPSPCFLPLRQDAHIVVNAVVEGVAGQKKLFEGSLPISGF